MNLITNVLPPSYETQCILSVCDWCRTVGTTRSATNASAAHLVTMVTPHVAHLMIACRVLVRSPRPPISTLSFLYLFIELCDDFFHGC